MLIALPALLADRAAVRAESEPEAVVTATGEPLTEGKCNVDSDCYEPPFNYCEVEQNECVHKEVFPQEPIEIIGLIVFGVIMALCTVAGIGGGGVAVAMLMAFFYFTTKYAISISVFSILVCSTSRYIYNLNTPHPEKPNVNLLDYGLASIMMPLTLAGAQFGGIVLDIFPESVIQIMLFLLLLFLTWSTFKKAIQLDRKERAAAAKKKVEESSEMVSLEKEKPVGSMANAQSPMLESSRAEGQSLA